MAEETKLYEEDVGISPSSSVIINDEDYDIEEIEKRILNFITLIIPNALLIREFNGNFVYQIETENIDAESIFI